MRRKLRALACVLAIASAAVWVALGANRGWTKTTRTLFKKDPITEQEYPVTERKFSPGIELLAGAFVVAGALALCSFFAPRNNS